MTVDATTIRLIDAGIDGYSDALRGLSRLYPAVKEDDVRSAYDQGYDRGSIENFLTEKENDASS